ncbi:GTPase [Halieaceae bacterium IMCC14734]|uniref:GTPase n=1 Tax=Candidatus Litorirhabdus singularis TaxID=2518993 RepID=A0ABT3TEG3_9GAMM|nr:GTPase [Candidatus Litorirhabdus singularis]MCX2979817.1 GTPase [Candidatus Litorirhabdus singularis]
MSNSEPIKLRIPRQDLAEFTVFGLTAEQAERWVETLPITNTVLVTQQLRDAIGELNRTNLRPDLRFQILETLRPTADMVLTAMRHYYLNQPVLLPEEPRKASRLARSLLEILATGYTISAIHTIQQRESLAGVNPAKLVCQAIHRAITTASMKLLLSYQLYQPVELNAWTELHQLYMLSERQQLTSQIVGDNLFGDGSIAETYLRGLMLGCCKPNQLRQRDLSGVFKGLRDWVRHTELLNPGQGNGLFLVDLASDYPPIYSSLYSDVPGPNCRLINTDSLVKHLDSVSEDAGDRAIVFDKDNAVSPNVLDHIITAWGVMSKRNFARASAQDKLWVSVGLSNTHYYVSGGIDFDEMIAGATATPAGNNPFDDSNQPHEKDVWDSAFANEDDEAEVIDLSDLEFHLREAKIPADTGERHPVFPARMTNVSPGGYCLEWSAEIPSHVKTGDVISVREVDNSAWSIAVIRWVSQVREDTTLLGVELLSPRAEPCAARIQHKTGEDGELMRALLLPEIKLVGQPYTLVTPRAGFKERQKVTLIRNGEESYIQLFKKVASTAAYNQFEFRYIQHLEEVAMRDRGDIINTQFESFWNNI